LQAALQDRRADGEAAGTVACYDLGSTGNSAGGSSACRRDEFRAAALYDRADGQTVSKHEIDAAARDSRADRATA
jgi:hypothetical protein